MTELCIWFALVGKSTTRFAPLRFGTIAEAISTIPWHLVVLDQVGIIQTKYFYIYVRMLPLRFPKYEKKKNKTKQNMSTNLMVLWNPHAGKVGNSYIFGWLFLNTGKASCSERFSESFIDSSFRSIRKNSSRLMMHA